MSFNIMRYADEAMLLVQIAPTYRQEKDSVKLAHHLNVHTETMPDSVRVILDIRDVPSLNHESLLHAIINNRWYRRTAVVIWVMSGISAVTTITAPSVNTLNICDSLSCALDMARMVS